MAKKELMTAQETAAQIIKRMADRKLKEAIVTRAMFIHLSGRARLDDGFWYAVCNSLEEQGWVTGSVFDDFDKTWDLYVVDRDQLVQRAKHLHYRKRPRPRRPRPDPRPDDGGTRLR
jgi:hypothetical protein